MPKQATQVALIRAIETDDAERVARILLADSANPREPILVPEPTLPIILAAQCGSLDTIDVLLNCDVPPGTTDEHGASVLHYVYCRDPIDDRVSYDNRLRLVKRLLDEGANPNALDGWRDTPLHEAASVGEWGACLLMLQAGASPHIRNIFGHTCLHKAVTRNLRPDIVRLLVKEGGADVNARDKTGATPLHTFFASGAKGGELVLCALLDLGADRDAREYRGNEILYGGSAPMHYAVRTNPAVVHRFIKMGAPLDSLDDCGQTPLMVCRNAAIADLLLRAGANPNIVDAQARTPLHHLAAVRDHEFPAALLDTRHVRIDTRDSADNTPLLVAARANATQTALALLQAGASPSATNNSGTSVMAFAMGNENRELADALLALRVDAPPEPVDDTDPSPQ